MIARTVLPGSFDEHGMSSNPAKPTFMVGTSTLSPSTWKRSLTEKITRLSDQRAARHDEEPLRRGVLAGLGMGTEEQAHRPVF